MRLFDVLGPVMIGPSSSHTAGAARIGYTAQKLLGDVPAEADIGLYGSFATTGRGHGTDRALVAGLLGLVCDPVAGLVEGPCVKRNVVGAVNAVSCANMALAGVDYAIPCDEVIDAMGRVGSLLSPDLRETGQGGLAATPTGLRIAQTLAEQG